MAKQDSAFHNRLLATFKVEADEHVHALSAGLIGLEHTASAAQQREIIETVFREAHSLKGAARAVEQRGIETLCQSVESVFAMLQRGEAALLPALFDLLHEAVDALGRFLPVIDAELPGDEKAALIELCRRLNGVAAGAAVTPSQKEAAIVHENIEERPTRSDTLRIPVARLDSVLLQAEGLLSAKLTAAQRSAELRAARAELAELKKAHTRIAPEVRAVQHVLERPQPHNGARRNDPPLHRLLEFMAWQEVFVKSFGHRLNALVRDADRDGRALGGMIDGLLDGMKQVLMLPMVAVLELLPKLVRDLSRDRGKDVDLAIEGGEIEIDRRILEEMRDPLIHLLRNSIDHGIETPEQRRRSGKPARGTITLAVTQKDAGRIEIRVDDDGAGIDVAKLREAARKLCLHTPEELAALDTPSALALAFHSGVSTSPLITDLSGRGLGLAIVREKAERLGGRVTLESQAGIGSTFRLALPLTLSTYRGVHVRTAAQRFVVPTAYVERVAKVKRETIKSVENRETILIDGQAVALVRLADALQLASAAPDGASDFQPVVIVGSAAQRIAFSVDAILNEQEVLVKGLGKQLVRVRNVAGATVLGSGEVAPILHVPDLLQSAVRVVAAPLAAARAPAVAARRSILVAEDSITARMLLKGILESAGYDVVTAVDGVDAYTQLRTTPVDLVVSDVDMPRMSGFDLTAKIRADKKLAELPLVLVTALETREHRERGIDVGANAYIVKSSFDQGNLLEVVRRLL